jgi:chromosome segregation ATPase
MSYRNIIYHNRLVMVALILCGCITDDPRQGGLLGGIQGLSSGSYERRLYERETSLTHLNSQNSQLGRKNSELQNEAGKAALERKRLNSRIAALNASTAQLNEKARRMRMDTEAARQQKVDFEKRLNQVGADIDALKRQVGENMTTAEAAEQKRRKLAQELDDLMVVSNALQ